MHGNTCHWRPPGGSRAHPGGSWVAAERSGCRCGHRLQGNRTRQGKQQGIAGQHFRTAQAARCSTAANSSHKQLLVGLSLTRGKNEAKGAVDVVERSEASCAPGHRDCASSASSARCFWRRQVVRVRHHCSPRSHQPVRVLTCRPEHARARNSTHTCCFLGEIHAADLRTSACSLAPPAHPPATKTPL